MTFRLLVFMFFTQGFLFPQTETFTEKNLVINRHIDGTLTSPANNTDHLAIIIGGSGPTDRDGNQNFLKNNALKKLAYELAKNGVATFRYDKRIVKQIRLRSIDPNIMFDDFVEDAIAAINYFTSKKIYNKIYIIGHSQGSLVGILASKNNVHGFISLAGAGQNIGDVLIEQISKTAPQFSDQSISIINNLKKGKLVNNYPDALTSIFKEDIQLFMINWMQYNPSESIKTLKIPILIINGSKDLQVSINEANMLKEAMPDASLKIIQDMNHVLVMIAGDDLENSKSYNEPNRKVSEELIEHIVTFIESNK
ncbi:S9 family peptidase [Aestuariivivens sp. NBU2969]|uniref:alpha/beta hydrolase family protein n=1 Tax=Aestuariivivens sp. NBU2969 TaxID=2873267 RepID=UPI001CBC88DB|nr:alpha/beta hydrolase [Aestuariivivens sp. NBU2969]